MASDLPKAVPLTCHGHSRPITHLSFSSIIDDDQFYLISACKDNNPMLRDGMTGDWIGTFLGHKGAVWQARLSQDANLAATGSADFSAKIWNTHTGECLYTLQHDHIVRAVAFPNQHNPQIVATGGAEKKFRIFDLTRATNADPNTAYDSSVGTACNASAVGMELGAGVHGGTIKSIIWNQDSNILTTASDDRKVRWWDLRTQHYIVEKEVNGPIGSCELDKVASRPNDAGILSVAAGKSAYFFDGSNPGALIKQVDFKHEIASVAVNADEGRFVTGQSSDTWARVFDLNTQEELEVQKGHHGPIWTIGYTPDGKMYGTGSEDGTIKLWKACREPYGLWR